MKAYMTVCLGILFLIKLGISALAGSTVMMSSIFMRMQFVVSTHGLIIIVQRMVRTIRLRFLDRCINGLAGPRT